MHRTRVYCPDTRVQSGNATNPGCDRTGREAVSIHSATAESTHRGSARGVCGWPQRVLPTLGGKTLMAILLVAAVAALTTTNSRLPRPDQDDEAEEIPGSGIIVRSEVVHLQIPETFRDLAYLQSQAQVLSNHNDLRLFLEQRHQTDLWYAVTTRGHQVNGGHSDITFVRHPYDDPHHFQEVLDILARAIGRTDDVTSSEFFAASVSIISN
jgi:hypothetical protein